MSDNQSLSDIFAAWGAPTLEERTALVAAAVGSSFYYADPHAPEPITDGRAFVKFIGMFSANMPGASAQLVEPVDAHHGHARATVRFMKGDDVMMTGQYFADLDADGKITRLIGFPGKGPE